MKHDKIDLFCNRSYRTGLIKRLKSRRYVKIRAVRFTRQKRRSVDIGVGSVSCFEERKRARRLKQQIVRAGERHISTGIIANASRRMATVFHAAGSARLFGLSHSLAYAQGGGAPVHVRMGRRFLLPRSAHPPALAGSSFVGAFSPARQLNCSELVLSILCALRCGRLRCIKSSDR